jgi:hypothetical protein
MQPKINPEYARWLADICEEVREDGFPEYWHDLILQDHNGKSYEIDVVVRETSEAAHPGRTTVE